VTGVVLRVEMQTATSKVLLVEQGGAEFGLTPGQIVETVVHHEIKELGQHVLACTISYRLPPSPTRSDPGVQSFRKFYKFGASRNSFSGLFMGLYNSSFETQVTNPLSVKTKAHVPRSPSALLSAIEREKVFLEVHIQNLTQDMMWFEHMYFEPVDGWRVLDGNLDKDDEGVFTGSMALMQPQDMRQYVYILAPIEPPDFSITHAPGAIIALGRLDIKWRSSYGEPGRLLTSVCIVVLCKITVSLTKPRPYQDAFPSQLVYHSLLPSHLIFNNVLAARPRQSDLNLHCIPHSEVPSPALHRFHLKYQVPYPTAHAHLV
jgi:trafficking protein particle complex subunit 13